MRELLTSLLPIRGISVTLKWLSPAELKPFHQPALSAFLRGLIEHKTAFNEGLVIDCPESPRMRYSTGDYYRFTVYAFANYDQPLFHLIQQLSLLPNSAPLKQSKLPFRDNVQLVSICDTFSGQAINDFFELCEYDYDTLCTEASLWQNKTVQAHWLSPARIRRKKEDITNMKGEQRYCRDNAHVPPAMLIERVYNTITSLIRALGGDAPYSPAIPFPQVQGHTHAYWVDANYHDEKGKKKTMGGLLGHVHFSDVEKEWLPWIVLGQYTGIGHYRAFGWGRYQLRQPDGQVSMRRTIAAHPILTGIRDGAWLEDAWTHISQGKTATDKPKTSFKQNYDSLESKLNKVLNESYTVPSLSAFELKQANKDTRTLLIAPFEDRVLQRATAQWLTSILESLFSNRSYGYRPGRSREGAKEQICHLIRKGYRWVAESDIEKFFDKLDRKQIQSRLDGIFQDSTLTNAVLNWLSAPISTNRNIQPRPTGIPQGSPLSPLMANLVLDDFDNDMHSQGYQCIRFADDFIILCKTEAQAKRALQSAERSLAEHGLSLNQSKTKISPTDKGFEFLGYLFLNDLVVENREKDKQHLDRLKQSLTKSELTFPSTSITSSDEIDQAYQPHSKLVCIAGPRCVLSNAQQRLEIKRDKELVASLAWRQIRSLVIFGQHHITTPALTAALRHDVAVHFSSPMGQYIGSAGSGRPPHGPNLWLKQIHHFDNEQFSLSLSHTLIEAKIKSQAEVLRKRNLDHHSLLQLVNDIPKTKDTMQLNGVEGHASQHYFQQLGSTLPDWANFTGRNRRPPLDPFNTLLSLGYTLLFGYCDSIARSDGLYPWQGFYHKQRSGHASLASDLVEPFRYEVDRFAHKLLTQSQLSEAHFYHDHVGACMMEREARRWYLSQLTQQFLRDVTHSKTKVKASLIDHIHKQNISLTRALAETGTFEPWSIR
ncbi:CRISPR-associated endonuclease Cas1 [Vibrio alfacsensis]|uniref:CRISPR-associated endonuclease Cas1 n=1 Tax=Vibrio alfacsensis TaxID=1074311 RepID=UPI004067C97B